MQADSRARENPSVYGRAELLLEQLWPNENARINDLKKKETIITPELSGLPQSKVE